jgi:hypothetical protein
MQARYERRGVLDGLLAARGFGTVAPNVEHGGDRRDHEWCDLECGCNYGVRGSGVGSLRALVRSLKLSRTSRAFTPPWNCARKRTRTSSGLRSRRCAMRSTTALIASLRPRRRRSARDSWPKMKAVRQAHSSLAPSIRGGVHALDVEWWGGRMSHPSRLQAQLARDRIPPFPSPVPQREALSVPVSGVAQLQGCLARCGAGLPGSRRRGGLAGRRAFAIALGRIGVVG